MGKTFNEAVAVARGKINYVTMIEAIQ